MIELVSEACGRRFSINRTMTPEDKEKIRKVVEHIEEAKRGLWGIHKANCTRREDAGIDFALRDLRNIALRLTLLIEDETAGHRH